MNETFIKTVRSNLLSGLKEFSVEFQEPSFHSDIQTLLKENGIKDSQISFNANFKILK